MIAPTQRTIAGQRGPGPGRRDERQSQLARLRTEVSRVQQAVLRVQAETRRLAEIEATRRLTAGEAGQVGALRRESEGLRLELALFREEFERVRLMEGRPSRPPSRSVETVRS